MKKRALLGAFFINDAKIRSNHKLWFDFGPAKYQMMKPMTGRTMIRRIHNNFALVLVFVLMICAIAQTSRTKMITLNSQPM